MSVAAPSSRASAQAAAIRLGALLALAASTGCDRLERFDLEEGELYCGRITLGSAYRQGFSPRLQMRMSWNDAALDDGSSPGTLTTFDAGLEEGRQRMVDEAPLRPFAPLAHDPLGALQFGEGREANFIYGVSPADPSSEAVLAVVSLRSDDQIEVRLMRPGAPELEAPGRQPLFGLFLLSRQSHDCF